MASFLDDDVIGLGEKFTQDRYIKKLQNSAQIFEIKKFERHSLNPRNKHNYTSDCFFAHLCRLDAQCTWYASTSGLGFHSTRDNQRPVRRLYALKQRLRNIGTSNADVDFTDDNELFDFAENNWYFRTLPVGNLYIVLKNLL